VFVEGSLCPSVGQPSKPSIAVGTRTAETQIKNGDD
jgi:hypothetical protein